MKKLTKTLLINWLYYDKLVLNFADINYIVGKNASGKSTFIDALMIVLLGEVSSRNFNKAANEGARRSLKQYLRADMDPQNPKSRRGRSFNSYIACEFLDDVAGKSFTVGIIFDCHADGSERHNFFYFEDKIPEDCFIRSCKPMDISELRYYLRDTYKSKQEIYDSHKKYRSAVKAKWNIHVDTIFSVLKQGAFFKPIDNIRTFITENVCDIQEKPDIVSMQQNIQNYKHQEKLAARQENRLTHLQKIYDLYRRHLRARELLDVHEFLKAKAEAEIERALVVQFEVELNNCKLELETLDAESKRLISQAEELRIRRDGLIASEPFKEFERLEAEKVALLSEQERLQCAMENTANAIRTEVLQWLKYCEKLEKVTLVQGADEKVIGDLPALRSALGSLEQLRSDDFGQMDMAPFTQAGEALARHMELLREACYELENILAAHKVELDECKLSLKELEKGNKSYPEQLLRCRAAIKKRLLEDKGLNIPLYPLADLLEITDPAWQKAVEGYLNTQRFLLIVEPKHYLDALRAYNKTKREFPGYGLVDIEKVRGKRNVQRPPSSLATKVTPTSGLVKEYIDFLLGRVICCDRVEDLRNHSMAITAEGMLYQGYVSRAIPREILDSVYIGKHALEQQILAQKERIQVLGLRCEALNQAFSTLENQKKKEVRLTKYYVEETVSQMLKNYVHCQEMRTKLDELGGKLDELGRRGFLGIAEQIKGTNERIAANRKAHENCSESIGSRKERVKRLEYEILPEHCQKVSNKEDLISERFSEEFISRTGKPKYQEELTRLKSPKSIAKNFGDQLEQTKRRYDDSWRNLVFARRDYISSFPPCSYPPESMINDDFDRELERLSKTDLPTYKEKIKAAHQSALEQFKNDFIAKVFSNIEAVESQVRELNKALKQTQFGADKYRFIAEKSPDHAEYYNMIKDPDWVESSEGLFSAVLQSRYGVLIEELFRKIVASDEVELNARKQSELQENIEKYTDYRTYLHFDLETTDQNGKVEYLSETLKTKSGGETQTPFYIAILASFAQVYKIHDKSSFGNTMRLVVFDEAFNKMDSERIVECVHLLRKMGLQAIFSTPPDKLPDIMPEADATYLAYHDRENYHMQIVAWSKEMEATVFES